MHTPQKKSLFNGKFHSAYIELLPYRGRGQINVPKNIFLDYKYAKADITQSNISHISYSFITLPSYNRGSCPNDRIGQSKYNVILVIGNNKG